MIKHYQIILEGEFQKLGYRFHTFLAAQTFNLKGSVCEKESKIIIDAEGSEDSLNKFIRWCQQSNGKQPMVQVIEKPLAYYNDFLIL
jgi:acylphosphatase